MEQVSIKSIGEYWLNTMEGAMDQNMTVHNGNGNVEMGIITPDNFTVIHVSHIR